MSLSNTLGYIFRHPWTRGARLDALGRLLRWQLVRRIHPDGAVFDWIDGARMLVFPGETGVTGNVYCGLHEFSHMAYILHICNETDFFVDVGANVGSYTVLACGSRGASGMCFEPVPETCKRLRANLGLNDLLHRVDTRQQAVGDADGKVLFSSHHNSTNHVLDNLDEADQSPIEVPMMTLDSALAGHSPTILKIDVEGYEDKVLAGARRVLASASLHSVIAEINGSLRYGNNAESVVSMMREHGFHPYAYDPFKRSLAGLGDIDQDSGNTLFIKDLTLVQKSLRSARAVHWRGLSL